MKCIYALVEYGEYENHSFLMVKINIDDKEKLQQYCIDSQKVNDTDSITINLLAWVGNLTIVDDWMHLTDIHRHQHDVRRTIIRINEMNNNENKWKRHHLRHRKSELQALLDYKFKSIE